MAASCGVPDFGTNDKAYLARVCMQGPDSALGEILGRPPVCPSACLAETPDAAPTGEEGAVSPSRFTPQDASGPRHPFGVQVGAPRHRVRAVEQRDVEERSAADR